MKQFTTYIDEAGNTGDNLIDHQQPFYVMAAVSVPDDKKTVMELILHEKFESVREIEEKEIKGTKWVKATNKQPALKNIIYDLLDNGGDIHIAIVEKRFMIAGMAVNTFFDYASNHSQNQSWMCSPQKSIDAANHYYHECTDDELIKIGKTLRRPTFEGYSEAVAILKARALNRERIEMLSYTESNLKEIYDFESEPNDLFNDSVFHSPNLTSFHCVGNMLARMCRDSQRITSLVFDDCALCNDAYKKTFEMFSKADRDVEWPNGKEVLTWKYSITGLQTAKSDVVTLIQIADVVASSVEKVMQKISRNARDFNDYEKFILAHLFVLFDLNQVWLTMSDGMNRRFINSIKSSIK